MGEQSSNIVVGNPSLSELLVATWFDKARRNYWLCRESVRKAAEIALEQCNTFDVSVDGYDRWIRIDVHRNNGQVQLLPAEMQSLHEEDDLTEAQLELAKENAVTQWKAYRAIAVGKDDPPFIGWGYDQPNLALLDTRQFLPIRIQWKSADMFEFEETESGIPVHVTTPWQTAIAEVFKASTTVGIDESSLVSYVFDFHDNALSHTTAVSAEIARLNSTEAPQRILRALQVEYGEERVAAIIEAMYPHPEYQQPASNDAPCSAQRGGGDPGGAHTLNGQKDAVDHTKTLAELVRQIGALTEIVSELGIAQSQPNESNNIGDGSVNGDDEVSETTGDGNDVVARLASAMDPLQLKIVRIANLPNEEKGVLERMRLIIALDERFKGKISPEWAKLLGCSDARIRAIWKKHPELRYQKEEF